MSMMITIDKPMKPFSTLPGVTMVLPLSNFYITAYPMCFVIKNKDNNKKVKLLLENTGEVSGFSCYQDLDRAKVIVRGNGEIAGFFSFSFEVIGDDITLTVNRCSIDGISLKMVYEDKKISTKKYFAGEDIVISKDKKAMSKAPVEKLFLGCNKALNWDVIKRKNNALNTVLPIWFMLGQLTQQSGCVNEKKGVIGLIDYCKKAIEEKRCDIIGKRLSKILKAGFTSMMVPQVYDSNYYGIIPIDMALDETIDPYYLLTEGYALIRSLFFMQTENKFSVLPTLPKEFCSGRMTNIACDGYGHMHIEWTKKKIRQMSFLSQKTFDMKLVLRPDIKKFRVRRNKKDKGVIVLANETVSIKSHEFYFFDRFEK
jgi:hypothetical protein